jgi:hypothetical protein
LQSQWISNSKYSITNGIDEWNLAIQKTENDKKEYLELLDAKEQEWINNKAEIESKEENVRNYLKTYISGMATAWNDSVGGDPKLGVASKDITSLLSSIQTALNTNQPLHTIADDMSNFFKQQEAYAKERQANWEGQVQKTDGLERVDEMQGFYQVVGKSEISCTTKDMPQEKCDSAPPLAPEIRMNADGIIQYGYLDGQLENYNYSVQQIKESHGWSCPNILKGDCPGFVWGLNNQRNEATSNIWVAGGTTTDRNASSFTQTNTIL